MDWDCKLTGTVFSEGNNFWNKDTILFLYTTTKDFKWKTNKLAPPMYSELMGQLINKQFEARCGLIISWEIKFFQSLEFVLCSFSL